MGGGRIDIDGKSINDYVTRKFSENPADTLYFLDIDSGEHELMIVTNSGRVYQTTVAVSSGGESYLGIDLATGEITK
jgi:predicted RNA-binding protein with EMAP domain